HTADWRFATRPREPDTRETSVAVAKALGQIGDHRAVPILTNLLVHLLGDTYWRSTTAAIAEALGSLRDTRAIPALSEAIVKCHESGQPDQFPLSAVANALQFFGNEEAANVMTRALLESSPKESSIRDSSCAFSLSSEKTILGLLNWTHRSFEDVSD